TRARRSRRRNRRAEQEVLAGDRRDGRAEGLARRPGRRGRRGARPEQGWHGRGGGCQVHPRERLPLELLRRPDVPRRGGRGRGRARAGGDDYGLRQRWFGATGRRVPEIAVEGELDLDDALLLDDVSDEAVLKEAHESGRPVAVRASSAEAVAQALARPEVATV